MSSITIRAEDRSELRPAYCLLAAPAALAIVAFGLLHLSGTGPGIVAADVVRTVLIAAWAVTGLVVGMRQRTDRVAPIALGIAGLGGVALLFDSMARADPTSSAVDSWRGGSLACFGLALGAFLHLLVSLPDGRLITTPRRWIAGVGYLVGAVVGLLASRSDTSSPWVWSLLVGVVLVGGLSVANGRYRAAGATDRRRMQWAGWALSVGAEVVLVVLALELIADWPPRGWLVVTSVTALVPLSLLAGTDRRMLARVDHLLAHTVALAGLTALVLSSYVVVVLGLGRTPSGTERSLLLASMVAAAASALLYLPARIRLTDISNRLVYGERIAPDETLRTFGSRLTRAIPLDELMLQLAESLRKTMNLASAEVWTGGDGRLEQAAGVPHRATPPLLIGEKERTVVARAGVSGGTWVGVWLGDLVAGRDASNLRVAPIAHAGELLGLIVMERRHDADPPSEEDDRVVVELARQVGLALHNVQLDSALQASLEEVQRANAELRESRLRIVSAGDAERRRLERDLHDGAQQHLVAMAVKLRLAEDLTDDDPAEAATVIGELRHDLQDAIAELRALAHGIFPPLLSSGGLAEALPAAATRAALPTSVELGVIGRYSPEVEAAVYFCCLEALQNAGKHAGDGASIVVRVGVEDGRLSFEVCDDGAGFEVDGAAVDGHGFVNMTDRLGAIGGRLVVSSAIGSGTTIRGEIPVT